MRNSTIKRETNETTILCELELDGSGKNQIDTGVGFFDHMLDLMAFHGGFDLTMEASGDLHVCDHHTVEDCGIVLGQCFKKALGDKKGIARYGFMSLPMDETLCQVSLDISGRAYLVYNCELKRDTIGTFATEMVEEFLRAFAFQAGITLHVNVLYGTNDHHKVEAIFKGLGRALRAAIQVNSNVVTSTKGTLE